MTDANLLLEQAHESEILIKHHAQRSKHNEHDNKRDAHSPQLTSEQRGHRSVGTSHRLIEKSM